VDTTQVPLLASNNTFTGATTLQGGVSLPPTGTTAFTGFNSEPLTFTSTVYNTTLPSQIYPTFVWQAEPTGNNSNFASGTLNLLTAQGPLGSTPSETGLSINQGGFITFRTNQFFPNTVNEVIAGTGLTGGGTGAATSGQVTLNLDTTKVPLLASANTFTQPITFAAGQTFPGTGTVNGVSAASPLTATTSSGAVSLGLNTTALETTLNSVYPRLGAANTFTAPITFEAGQTFPGTLTGVTVAYPLTATTTGGVASLGLNLTGLEDAMVGFFPTFTGDNIFTGATNINGGGLAASASGSTSVKIAIAGTGTTGDVGVEGSSDTSTGVWGDSTSGNGVYGVTGSGYGVYGTAVGSGRGGYFTNGSEGTAALYASNSATSDAIAIQGQTTSTGGPSVYGGASGNDAYGIYGAAFGNGGTGVYGIAAGTFDSTGVASVGVGGFATQSIGVLGVDGTYSHSFDALEAYGYSAGIWGDTDVAGNGVVVASVAGTADNNSAAYFYNKSASFSTVVAYNEYPGNNGLFELVNASSPAGTCGIGGSGDLSCTGQLKSLVSASGGARKVETYAMQSPENWMEDFGSGSLERGVAIVKIDSAFAETVTGDASYHVFITPNGDSKGLYVIRKTATTFEVRESGGGVSTLTFDYRIVAKRRGYETQRLTDVTERFKTATKAMAEHPVRSTDPVRSLAKRTIVIPSIPPTPKAPMAVAHGPKAEAN